MYEPFRADVQQTSSAGVSSQTHPAAVELQNRLRNTMMARLSAGLRVLHLVYDEAVAWSDT